MTCVGLLNETRGCERRVALVPDGVAHLGAMGLEVFVQTGAGVAAHIADAAYVTAGATLVGSPEPLYNAADIIVRVSRPSLEEVGLLRQASVLIGMLQPDAELVERLASCCITAFSLERMPRIARAQSMDALSSQSSLSGYKAVLLAANAVDKLFPMLMTAAGTVAPAKVLVLGAGVAGLQAIATARRLGAVVQGYDIRSAAKEQVESLGARFISPVATEETETSAGYAMQLADQSQRREREVLARAVQETDVVITTALVPGRKAPLLLTSAMVESMAEGSVIVDVAAEAGGNCELTLPGQTVVRNGVTIIGEVNLPSTVAAHASQLYSHNVTNFLTQIVCDGRLVVNLDDVVVDECCVTHGGQVRHGLGRTAVVARA